MSIAVRKTITVPADGVYEPIPVAGQVVYVEQSPVNTPAGAPTFHLYRGGDGAPLYSRSALAWLPRFKRFYVRGTADSAGETLYLLVYDDPCTEGVYGSGGFFEPNQGKDCEESPNTFEAPEYTALVYHARDDGLYRRDLETWDNKTQIWASVANAGHNIIGYDPTSDRIYFIYSDAIHYVDADGGTRTSIFGTQPDAIRDGALNQTAREVYYGQGSFSSGAGCLLRVHDIAADSESTLHDFGVDRYCTVDYDPLLNKLYVITTGSGTATFYRCNPDGTDMETLGTLAKYAISPKVHPNIGYLYYCEPNDDAIRRVKLSDMTHEVIAAGIRLPGVEGQIQIDFLNAKIYFWGGYTGQGTPTVYRCDLDGSNLEALFTASDHITGLLFTDKVFS